jgi:hypothetical protein
MQLLEAHRFFRIFMILIIVSGCSSSTIINTEPQGAQVFVNDQPVGTTPYTYSDRKTIGSTTRISIKKEGYEDFNTLLVRNEEFDPGACAGGVFLLVPFLWVQKYTPERTFELTSLTGNDEIIDDTPEATPAPVTEKSVPAKKNEKSHKKAPAKAPKTQTKKK